VSVSLVVDPDLGFVQLDARLVALGFVRDPSVRPVTPDTIAGEPELAAWSRGGERVTYTFNPVVSMRSLTADALSAETSGVLESRLPLLDPLAVGMLLTSAESRRILLGIFAARALDAGDLALIVASLQMHAEEPIRRAAAAALPLLQASPRATPRQQTLTTMQILCRRAIPALAALVGPDGASALEAMRPRAEDYARVFDAGLVDAVRAAYEEMWQTPPELERLVSGEITLRVDAAPAGMLGDENELTRRFPGGYRTLAPYLVPDRVWFVWRYVRAGADTGMRYDGVVLLDDRWVWFPKPYLVVGTIVETGEKFRPKI